MTRVLAGDIGGTNAKLALYRRDGDRLDLERRKRFASREAASVAELLSRFLAEAPAAPIDAACLAVAGPVFHGAAKLTNLPWRIDAQGLAAALPGTRTRIVNDLEAAAWGMLHLPASSYAPLNPPRRPGETGTIAVIAAGTGLGEAVLHWDGASWRCVAGEGGHACFAPQTERDIALLRFLAARDGGQPSWERVLSGQGIVNIYQFLRQESSAFGPDRLAVADGGDPAPAITAAGLEGRDATAAEALRTFARLYGAEAGNLALRCLATGGVRLGGGIAPRLLPVLREGAFMSGFTANPRFGELLSGLEVSVCLDVGAALLGAAHLALETMLPPEGTGAR